MKRYLIAVALVALMAGNSYAQFRHRPRPTPGQQTGPAQPRLLFNSQFADVKEISGGSPIWRTKSPFGAGLQSNASEGEVEVYVDVQGGGTYGPNPFSITASGLKITASPTAGLPAPFTYTSGALSTLDMFNFTYGYAEIKAQMPQGKGFWFNFQLFGDPMNGFPEVDICQFSSKNPKEHYPCMIVRNAGEVAGDFVGAPGAPDLSAGMHTYGVEWTSTGFKWYVDRQQVLSSNYVVNTPLFVTVNLACGDGGGLDDPTVFVGPPDGTAQSVTIRYVQVWDKRPF